MGNWELIGEPALLALAFMAAGAGVFAAMAKALRGPHAGAVRRVGVLTAGLSCLTMASFWATPSEVLARWKARDVQLAPPTHRTLEMLSAHAKVDHALAAAEGANLESICPALIDYDGTIALTLPGDPNHPQATRISAGQTRYVLRGEQWRPEDPPGETDL